MGAHDSFNEFEQIKKVCFLLIKFLIYIKSINKFIIYYGRDNQLKNTYLINIQ